MYRYVDQAEVERPSVCFPFGKAFHAALTAQAWECMMGNSLRQDELVERFSEAFRIEAEATPNLIYKEGENFDTVIDLATKMLDAALANRVQYAINKGVFLPNETSFACGECPYRDRCKQWHLKRWR